MKTNNERIKMTDTFWKLTYADGEIEYTEKAPYDKGSYTEYNRLVKVGNPVIRFELVKASNSIIEALENMSEVKQYV
jgi:hypothetical protein